MDRQREINLDILRGISAFCVILIHINWVYFERNTGNNMEYYFEVIINLLTRFCVPCFLMLSGALLMRNPKNANFMCFYKKSMHKIFCL